MASEASSIKRNDWIGRQQRAMDDDIHRLFSYAVFFAALVGYACTSVWNNPEDLHEHTIQAWCWLHGHMAVTGWPIHEVGTYLGQTYVLHPPLPTLIDLPFVALFGPLFPQVVLSVVIGAITVMLIYRLTHNLWITLFVGFGTVLWYEATLGAVWGYCAVLSTAFTTAALFNVGRNHWKVGIYAGLAALARYDLVVTWPMYMLLCWYASDPPFQSGADDFVSNNIETNHRPTSGPGSTLLLPGLFLSLAIYAVHAYLKYGVPYDRGLSLWYAADSFNKIANHGPFSLYYLPLNLYTALFIAPGFVPHFPWIMPTPNGQALILTSPALLLALGAPINKKTITLWMMVLLSMSGCMLVWSNGVEQYGARYWIQALPFLAVLMADAVGRKPDRLSRVLVILSVLLVAWGTMVIRLFGWAG